MREEFAHRSIIEDRLGDPDLLTQAGETPPPPMPTPQPPPMPSPAPAPPPPPPVAEPAPYPVPPPIGAPQPGPPAPPVGGEPVPFPTPQPGGPEPTQPAPGRPTPGQPGTGQPVPTEPTPGQPVPTEPAPGQPVPPPGTPADPSGSTKPTPPEGGASPGTITPPTTPDEQSPGHWDVDVDKLNGFAMAVTSARFGLAAVQTRVERMQGDDYTPKLGTSPVGKQLAKKFDDRLNGEQGLRGLLAEAMRRMDQFIESAEKVRDSYRETETEAEETITRAKGE